MAKRLLAIIFISAFSAIISLSQIVSQDDMLRQAVSKTGQAEVSLPCKDRKTVDILTRDFSIISVRDKMVHLSLSPLTIELFLLRKYDYLITERAENKGITSALSLMEAMNWEKYPTYTQYDSIMLSFSKLYPSLCRLDTIGKSINGKLVLALKISDNASSKEDEPEVFYSSTIHGDETGGFVLMLHLADYLLKNYNLNSRVKNLVDNLEIWINPLANPDGTYRSGNTISSPTRFNANGFDLNRNFPDPVTPNTIRQVETIDMINFLRRHRFVLSANFHSGAEVVNYPWDRWISKFHADNYWFRYISRAYADTVHVYSGPAYMSFLENGITRGADWYLVYGGRQDFITSELQGREVTIELDNQFITPAAQLELLWQNNWRSLLGYLENALYGIHGLVRNANSHVPVPARIFTENHDKDSSHIYSDTLTGSFVRLLSSGTWSLTFSAAGYWPTVVKDVVVTSGQKTDLIVDMSPIPSSIESITSPAPLFVYPNPATEVINVMLPEMAAGNWNIEIINHDGRLLSDFNTEVDQGIPLLIDIKSLTSGVYTILFSNKVVRKYFYGRFVVIK